MVLVAHSRKGAIRGSKKNRDYNAIIFHYSNRTLVRVSVQFEMVRTVEDMPT
jgi:hypothetical protein